MISKEIRDQYTVTIGIECHVQLKTATKLFAAVGNDARDAVPNTLVSHICFGLPGALPVLNREAVHLAMRAAFALGTPPQAYSAFDRKHYFYPDLPLGYQITQFENPIIRDGFVTIEVNGQKKRIGIHEAHIESDAGKSTHPAGKDYSLVDLNRAGTPLLEIVSEPDMHTAEEARIYAKELYLRMKYADVSDANLYYGNMRFDINVSVSKTDELGTRTETKNINSFKAVEKTIEFETTRQIEQLEKGQAIVQETRGWDDAKQRTFSLRAKEDAHDYRYFPDPDLPPVKLAQADIDAVAAEMPIMPDVWRDRLKGFGLNTAQIDTLLDAEVEEGQVAYLPLIEMLLDQPDAVKDVVNWMINVEIPLRREGGMTKILSDSARTRIYLELYELVKMKKLSSSNAKSILSEMVRGESMHDIEAFAKQHNLIQESDESALIKIANQVIAENPKAAEDVKNGEMKAIGFLVGQVMKLSQGRANPKLAQDLLRQQLGL
ncbi:MAG: Asp-tRNA(Asn)/Glu-tRNA(Gln) amidotransferase subunit GatB [Candidatus Saccharibacteria bacterium]